MYPYNFFQRLAASCSNLNVDATEKACNKAQILLAFNNLYPNILTADMCEGSTFKDIYGNNSNNNLWKKFRANKNKRDRQIGELDDSLKSLIDANPEERDTKLKEFYGTAKKVLNEVNREGNLYTSRLGEICGTLVNNIERTSPTLCKELDRGSSPRGAIN